jgi:hypothetical protein
MHTCLDQYHANKANNRRAASRRGSPIARMARTATSRSSLMQLSFTLLLRLVDLQAEHQKRYNRVVVDARRHIGARH